jgi:hypothetical protein
MGNLLLNSLVVRQQASGAKNQKNSEQNAHYLLTIMTSRTKRASSKQPAFKKLVSILLTIMTRREPGARGAEVVVDAERQRNPRLYGLPSLPD